MTHVVVLDSISEDIFVCGACKHVFNTLQLFLDHKEKCVYDSVRPSQSNDKNNTKMYDKQDPINEKNKLHKVSHETELNCNICKKRFKKVKSLQVHLRFHNEKPYQCVLCGRCFIQNSHLQRHIPTHKVWPGCISERTAKSTNVDIRSYSCVYCDLILSNYSLFRTHMKTHVSHKKYKCIQGTCNSFHETLEGLIDHISLTHATLKYSCHNCHKDFASLEDIALHYQSYNNTCFAAIPQSNQHKCPQCDAIFRKAEKLSLHLLVESHKNPCMYCNKVFASDKRLRMHLQIHQNVKPYRCNICGQNFLMKKYLSAHMLKHGERDYKCKVCKHAFKRKDLLQRHMKSHQLRKLYKCPFIDTLNCKKEFTRSDNLQMHIKHHTKRIFQTSKPT